MKVSAMEAAYMTEKDQMTETVQTLSKEVSTLKGQNEELCIKMEQMKDVLRQSKDYCQSLNKQVQDLASEMDFQNELHQQERQVWKRSAQKRETGDHEHNKPKSGPASDMNNIEMDVADVGDALSHFKQIIARQKEEIKYKTEQMAHKEQITIAATEQMKKRIIARIATCQISRTI